MALRYATATGNWSNVAIWDGGTTLPGVADDVYANAKTVTIDQDITVLSLNTAASAPAVQGGSFVCSTGRTINATTIQATNPTLTISVPYGVTANVNANTYGAATLSTVGITFSGLGQLNFTGNATGNLTSGTGTGLSVNGGGTFVMVGNCYGGNTNGGYGVSISACRSATITGDVKSHATGLGNGLLVSAPYGTVTINGNVGGSSTHTSSLNCSGAGSQTIVNGNITGGPDSASHGATVSQTHVLTVNGDVTGGTNATGTCYGINATLEAGGEVNVNGRAIGGSGLAAYGVFVGGTRPTVYIKEAVGSNYPNGGITNPNFGVHSSLAAAIITVGSITCGTGGWWGVGDGRYVIDDTANNVTTMMQSSGGSTFALSDVSTDYPAEEDVRSGVSYAYGSLEGTCAVPGPESVLTAVPVDATVGVVSLRDQDIANALGPSLVAFSP
jgi:hypothetical protein